MFIGAVFQLNITPAERLFDSEHDLGNNVFRIRDGRSRIKQKHIAFAPAELPVPVDESAFPAPPDNHIFLFEPFQRAPERIP